MSFSLIAGENTPIVVKWILIGAAIAVVLIVFFIVAFPRIKALAEKKHQEKQIKKAVQTVETEKKTSLVSNIFAEKQQKEAAAKQVPVDADKKKRDEALLNKVYQNRDRMINAANFQNQASPKNDEDKK